jgi:hypothetical protein
MNNSFSQQVPKMNLKILRLNFVEDILKEVYSPVKLSEITNFIINPETETTYIEHFTIFPFSKLKRSIATFPFSPYFFAFFTPSNPRLVLVLVLGGIRFFRRRRAHIIAKEEAC